MLIFLPFITRISEFLTHLTTNISFRNSKSGASLQARQLVNKHHTFFQGFEGKFIEESKETDESEYHPSLTFDKGFVVSTSIFDQPYLNQNSHPEFK